MPKRSRRKSTTRNTRRKSSSAVAAVSDAEPDVDVDVNDDEVVEAEPAQIPVVESLVAGRERRATAGNRLATLLDKEANKDDELELLFQEAEDDVEFEAEEEEEAGSDVQLESSDEDDEEGGEGAEAGQEDLAGERELEAAARAEKAKKRKAPETFFKPPRNATVPKKKVTIVERDGESTPTSVGGQLTPSEAVLSKHRKKSERISWIPTEGPTRSSSRKLSLQNRAVTHQRLKESEARRLHTIALMEAAAKKKKKENPKREMTQAERLEEAKKTEEMNQKSLNSWEESEAARAEQQRARLAALQNRKLNGAVIRWWSGQAEWDEKGRLVRVGKRLIEEVPEIPNKEKEKKDNKKKGGRPRGKSKKAVEEPIPKESGQTTEDDMEGGSLGVPGSSTNTSPKFSPIGISQPQIHAQPQLQHVETRKMASITDLTTDTPPKAHALPPTFGPHPNTPLLDGILYYASLPTDPSKPQAEVTPKPPLPKPQYSTRNLVILQNFEESQLQSKESIAESLFPDHVTNRESKMHSSILYVSYIKARFD